MLGLRAWSDDLVVVLFEFLEVDTKLAQSCADFGSTCSTVVLDPAMRVMLSALVGRELSRAHSLHIATFFSFF